MHSQFAPQTFWIRNPRGGPSNLYFNSLPSRWVRGKSSYRITVVDWSSNLLAPTFFSYLFFFNIILYSFYCVFLSFYQEYPILIFEHFFLFFEKLSLLFYNFLFLLYGCFIVSSLSQLAWWQWAGEEGHWSLSRDTFILMGKWSPGQLDCHGCQQVCENNVFPMAKGAGLIPLAWALAKPHKHKSEMCRLRKPRKY